MRCVTVLGSTGSIGESTLDVMARHPARFRAYALVAHTRADKMLEQVRAHRPDVAVMVDPVAAQTLERAVRAEGLPTRVASGAEAACEVAAHRACDTVMAAIVGAAGLQPTLAAAHAGKRVLLANKEALVMAGQVFMGAVAVGGAELLPIDSEHNAIFQSLPRNFARGALEASGVTRLLLTASGGPFLATPLARLAGITPEQAVAHPNWVMGRKISVDSSTMMNKGLEVIEAHWLFGVPAEQIEVVIHPQSVIHSLVGYADGSVIAQLGNPDMRTPIAYALDYPERIAAGVTPLDLFKTAHLSFEKPDLVRFPCLRLAYEALKAGENATAVLNAANEVAVQAFLDRQLPYMRIADVVEKTLERVPRSPLTSLAQVLATDAAAREMAGSLL